MSHRTGVKPIQMTAWCHLPTIFNQRTVLRPAGLFALSVALIATLFLDGVSHAAPGVNQTLSFQGRLTLSTGGIVADGYYNFQFKLYQDGAGTTANNPGGTLKWTENHINNGGTSGVQVKNGYFSVNLGSVTPFGTSVDWNQDTLWLSMNVAGSAANCTTFGGANCTADGEMLPMKRITSVPFALNSGMVGGKTAENLVQLAQGVQTDASTNTSSIFINKTGTGNLIQLQNTATDVFSVGNSGDIALGSNANKSLSIVTSSADTAGRSLAVNAGGGGSGSGSSGGTLQLQGGAAGGTNGNGGNVTIDAGAKTGTGTNGSINIGTTNPGAITIGSSAATSGIALNQNTTIANDKTFTANGTALFKSATNSTTAFDVQNAAGTSALNVSTIDNTVTASNNLTVGTVSATTIASAGFESGTLAGWYNGNATTASVSSVRARTGTYSARFTSTPSATAFIEGTYTNTTYSTVKATLYVYATASTANSTNLFSVHVSTGGGTKNLAVYRTSTNNICVYRGYTATTDCSATAMGLNQWNKFELTATVNGANSSYNVKVNDVTALNTTGQNFGTDKLNRIILGETLTRAQDIWIDDVTFEGIGVGSSALTANGALQVNGASTFSGPAVFRSLDATATSGFQIQNQNGTAVGAVIQGASSQTANMLDFVTDTGTKLMSVTSAGNIAFGADNHAISVTEAAAGTGGKSLTVSAGAGGTGTGSTGGSLVLQGGVAGGTNGNGGNILLSGGAGTGTGASGLVVLSTPTFSTVTNDANCYTGGAIVTGNCSITATSVNNSSAILVGFSTTNKTATLPDPTITTAGRVFYVMAASNSQDFTLSVNGGGSSNNLIAMHANSAATMIWNGTDWVTTVVASGGGMALQSASSPTMLSADDSELVVEDGFSAKEFTLDEEAPATSTSTSPSPEDTVAATDESKLFTVPKAGSAPTGADPEALLGSMYYDTTLGKLQCYEQAGWGTCGARPDNFVTISPEYANAVMNGNDVGTITSDLCSDALNINDGSSSQPTVCGTNETYNFYKWTTAESNDQTRSIFITYQLPATFKTFIPGSTSLTGRTDSAQSSVTYQVYRDQKDVGLTSCGDAITVSKGPQSTWQKVVATGDADPSNCDFAPGDSIFIRVNLSAKTNANAYVSNVSFVFSNN